MASRRGRVHLVSLGCAKNQVDAERVLHKFGLEGFDVVMEPEDADVVVVNTCAFIQSAEAEAVETLMGAVALKQNKNIKAVVAAGCLVSRYGQAKLKGLIPELDAAFLPSEFDQVAATVRVLMGWERPVVKTTEMDGSERVLLSGAGTAYLKIAEGCSRRCAYCLIPELRGPLCSVARSALVREAEALVRQGAREIIVVAQDITVYGRDLKPRTDLNALLDDLVKIKSLHWIRLMYAYPDGINEGLVRRMAEEKKICKYLDMPVQHAHKHVLQRMGRPGDAETYLALLTKLRRRIPEIVLRTTLLSGFPGETEAEHEALKAFVRAAQFDRLGVFAYSKEKGTRAAEWSEQIPARTRERRRRELMDLQVDISRQRLTRWVGKTLECLVEEPSGAHHVLARTPGDAPEIDGAIVVAGHAKAGEFIRVRVTGSTDHDLRGERV